MPIYEYRCSNCGGEFEIMQKFSDEPLEFCAKCGGELHKLISQSSFHLKGSGWYATDYARKSGNGGPAKKEKKEGGSIEPDSSKADKVGEGVKK